MGKAGKGSGGFLVVCFCLFLYFKKLIVHPHKIQMVNDHFRMRVYIRIYVMVNDHFRMCVYICIYVLISFSLLFSRSLIRRLISVTS